jgi:hypothetical protein
MPDAPIVPPVEVRSPARVAPERPMLEAWLDYHRSVLLDHCAGLDGAQLATASCPPSRLSLLGLVRHMTEVEMHWFRRNWQHPMPDIYCTDESPDGDFDLLDPANAAQDVQRYRDEVEAARAEAARHELDEAMTYPARTEGRPDSVVSLRWVYVHMIEEYAQHNGHADLIRERIDGVTYS